MWGNVEGARDTDTPEVSQSTAVMLAHRKQEVGEDAVLVPPVSSSPAEA